VAARHADSCQRATKLDVHRHADRTFQQGTGHLGRVVIKHRPCMCLSWMDVDKADATVCVYVLFRQMQGANVMMLLKVAARVQLQVVRLTPMPARTSHTFACNAIAPLTHEPGQEIIGAAGGTLYDCQVSHICKCSTGYGLGSGRLILSY
jgi:hypothetical protein